MARGARTGDDEILREIALAPDPFVTASELSERLSYTRQGINNRLNELVEKGLLKRREVGARAVVYWLTDEGKEMAASRA